MDNTTPLFLNDFRSLLSARGLSAEQQEKVMSDIGEAISVNLIGRLIDKLSEEQKNQLSAEKSEKPDDVVKFFTVHISASQIKESLGAATEEVLNKFLDKIVS